MKKLYCDKCSLFVGEINNGKIKNNTILICSECNAETSAANVINNNDMSDFFSMLGLKNK